MSDTSGGVPGNIFLRVYGAIGAYIVFAPWWVWVYAFFTLFPLLAFLGAALPHDIYSHWAMPDQRAQDGKRAFSCCNNQDCAPRPSRWVNDHWEVQWNGRWLKVPDQKIEQNYRDAWDPGDKQSHACISGSGNIYCFRAGEWLQ